MYRADVQERQQERKRVEDDATMARDGGTSSAELIQPTERWTRKIFEAGVHLSQVGTLMTVRNDRSRSGERESEIVLLAAAATGFRVLNKV